MTGMVADSKAKGLMIFNLYFPVADAASVRLKMLRYNRVSGVQLGYRIQRKALKPKQIRLNLRKLNQ